MIESKDNPNEKDISLIGNIFINNNKKNYILMEKKNQLYIVNIIKKK